MIRDRGHPVLDTQSAVRQNTGTRWAGVVLASDDFGVADHDRREAEPLG
jgi:hypothetical protein